MNISELGEFELIARLTQGLTTHASMDVGVGDDCAILNPGGTDAHEQLLVTCDSQVENVHFTLRTSRPEQIGHKALAINLSDIAAMGGVPRYALISLLLPAQLPVAVLDGVYAGIRALATRYETALVGGNISGNGESKQLVIDVTLLGTIERGRALLRSGAHVGDLLCVTGTLGDSGAGLYLLQHPEIVIAEEQRRYLQERHIAPTPRVLEGRALSGLGHHIVTAMLDISDGLSGDLFHLCEASHVGAQVTRTALPLSPALRALAREANHDPFDWALHGGEDYELFFTVAPEHLAEVQHAVREATGTPITVIGTMHPFEHGIHVRFADGHLDRLDSQSWDHLQRK